MGRSILAACIALLLCCVGSKAISAPEDPDLTKARTQFEAGDIVGAIELWSGRLIRQPDHQSARFNRAQAYLVLEQHQLALDDLQQLLSIQQGRPIAEAYIMRGVALTGLGRHQQALEDFDTAWRLGKSPTALANKAMTLNSLGRRSEAYALMEQLVQIEASTANFLNLASLQKSQGNPAACIQTTSSIIRSTPTHAQAYALRGLCKEQQGQSESALADLLRSQSLAPHQPDTLLAIGTILRKRGKQEEGTQWILKAASLYLIDRKPIEHKNALQAAQATNQNPKH
ncbi:MAG: hypothetical protein RLZZ54_2843 [Cyanobacteriota bacterium]|jgi:tetratricopeptide (TPR) repeat protein